MRHSSSRVPMRRRARHLRTVNDARNGGAAAAAAGVSDLFVHLAATEGGGPDALFLNVPLFSSYILVSNSGLPPPVTQHWSGCSRKRGLLPPIQITSPSRLSWTGWTFVARPLFVPLSSSIEHFFVSCRPSAVLCYLGQQILAQSSEK